MNTTRVHIEMDSDIHRKMRAQAIMEDKTLREFIEMLVIKYLGLNDSNSKNLETM